jgi:hypothetical protein
VDVGTAITSAFSAGISMYGVIAALGIAGRLDVIDGPAVLERPVVIAVALVLFALEFVIDKLPVVDTLWDAMHAVLRPIAGAVILGVAPDQDLPLPVALAFGAGLAFTSHSAKSATRVLVNTSPEPLSNVVVSTAEDGLVAGLMALAFANPTVALAVTTVAVVGAMVVIFLAWRVARTVHRRWRRRRVSRPGGPPPDGAAPAGSPPPSAPPRPPG